MAKIDRILRAVESVPWAIQPKKLEAITEVLVAKAEAGSFPDAEAIAAMEAAQAKKVVNQGGIQVMQLFGTISRRMNMLDAMSGGTSIEVLSRKFDEAMADDAVSAIVLDVDSPGGSVYGVEELFQKIYSARGKKRVIAVADQLMASAAYYIGAAADELVVSPSGEVGSIGVFATHFDWSENLAAEGIKVTIIKAGENKAEGNPYQPLGDDAKAHLQELVNDYYGAFVQAVAKGRGVSVGTVRETFGQGRTFTAKRALQRGMVDRIATMDQVLADLTGKRKPTSVRQAYVPTPSSPNASALQGPDDGLGALQTDLSWTATDGTSGQTFADATVPESVPDSEPLLTDITDFLASATRRLAEASMRSERPAETDPQASIDNPSDAMGQASPDTATAPTEPAPEAREESMSGKDTAALTEGAATEKEAARAAEKSRIRSIRAIGQEHSIDAATVDKWIDDDLSVETVNGLALSLIRERAKASATVVSVGADREAEKPFSTFGEQLMAIYHAGLPNGRTDKRLLGINAAASGASEAVPADGGFLVQTDFGADILRRTYSLGEVASRVRRRPVGPNSNGLKLKAIDETSRANGSRYGGILAYWADEADTVTATRPKFRTMELSLNKLMALMYSTEELLQDAVALQGISEDAFAEEINFKVEDAVFRGSGAGQPLGILNAACLVSVTAESAQTAATINSTNVTKMFARLWPRSRMNAVWFINVDCEHQLQHLVIPDGSYGTPVYLPPGGLRDSPYGTLLGRPVIPVEYCSTLGTVGDIILADLDQYLMIDKGGVNQAWSIHVRFIYDEQTFKITYRCDGQPLWNAALTPYQGTNTLSPFVVLATRS